MTGGSLTPECEVLVVGAGPAGSAVASLLARRGRDVLVVDRAHFPRAKACGECLNPGGVAVLERLGLLESVTATAPVPLEGWVLCTPGGARAEARFPGGRFGLGLERRSFDRVLLDQARAHGARIVEGLRIVKVEAGTRSPSPRAVGVMGDGREIHIAPRILVGADGLRSVVARSVGTVRRRPRLRKASLTWRIRGTGPSRTVGRLFLGGDLTVGLAPVPPDPEDRRDRDIPRWNATLVVGPGARGPGKGAPATPLAREAWPLLLGGLERMGLRWRRGPEAAGGPWASGPFDWPSRTAAVGRTLLVGDAAGYYDPLTGQGLFRALRSAELASDAIRRALPSPSRRVDTAELQAYSDAFRRCVGPGRGIQRAIEGILARPGLRELGIDALALSPRAASLLVSVTGDVTGGIRPRGEGRRTPRPGNRGAVPGSRSPGPSSSGSSEGMEGRDDAHR